MNSRKQKTVLPTGISSHKQKTFILTRITSHKQKNVPPTGISSHKQKNVPLTGISSHKQKNVLLVGIPCFIFALTFIFLIIYKSNTYISKISYADCIIRIFNKDYKADEYRTVEDWFCYTHDQVEADDYNTVYAGETKDAIVLSHTSLQDVLDMGYTFDYDSDSSVMETRYGDLGTTYGIDAGSFYYDYPFLNFSNNSGLFYADKGLISQDDYLALDLSNIGNGYISAIKNENSYVTLSFKSFQGTHDADKFDFNNLDLSKCYIDSVEFVYLLSEPSHNELTYRDFGDRLSFKDYEELLGTDNEINASIDSNNSLTVITSTAEWKLNDDVTLKVRQKKYDSDSMMHIWISDEL